MTTSSTDLWSAGLPDLRTGEWTRLGDRGALGDEVTEGLLTELAEHTRTAARSAGYAVGWAEGRRAAEREAATLAEQAAAREAESAQRRETEHRAAVAVLEEAARRLEQEVGETCARVEDRAVAVALDLTAALLGRELSVAPAADAVRRALALLPDGPLVRVRMAPTDAADAATADLRGRATVVADPALAPGDVLVETDEQVVDGRIGTALDRVREVLAP